MSKWCHKEVAATTNDLDSWISNKHWWEPLLEKLADGRKSHIENSQSKLTALTSSNKGSRKITMWITSGVSVGKLIKWSISLLLALPLSNGTFPPSSRFIAKKRNVIYYIILVSKFFSLFFLSSSSFILRRWRWRTLTTRLRWYVRWRLVLSKLHFVFSVSIPMMICFVNLLLEFFFSLSDVMGIKCRQERRWRRQI